MGMIVRGCAIKLSKDGEETKVGEEANELILQFRKTKADQQSLGRKRWWQPACQGFARWSQWSSSGVSFPTGLEIKLKPYNLCYRFMSHSLRIGGGTEERRRSTASRW